MQATDKSTQKTAPFRADQVGSLLRSEAIKNARLQRAADEITAEQLRERNWTASCNRWRIPQSMVAFRFP
jgi:hypothetical protein